MSVFGWGVPVYKARSFSRHLYSWPRHSLTADLPAEKTLTGPYRLQCDFELSLKIGTGGPGR